LTKQKFPVVDGDIAVPEEPGLGADLDEKVVEIYRVT
jgi:L-alanine-DL-glutamate epimerase-like enolase superfamily enzyme